MFERTGDDPFAALDPDWIAEALAVLDTFDLAAESILQLWVPPSAQEIGDSAQRFARVTKALVRDFRAGLLSLDPAMIESGNAKLTEAAALALQVGLLAQSFCDRAA